MNRQFLNSKNLDVEAVTASSIHFNARLRLQDEASSGSGTIFYKGDRLYVQNGTGEEVAIATLVDTEHHSVTIKALQDEVAHLKQQIIAPQHDALLTELKNRVLSFELK